MSEPECNWSLQASSHTSTNAALSSYFTVTNGRDGQRKSFSDEPIPGCAAGYLSPLATAVEVLDGRRVLKLADLVHFQLARYRLDDAVDLRDMLDVGVIDASWVDRYPEDLAKRLQHLVDTPDG